MGYRKWEIANVGGLSLLPSKGIDLSFDTSLYCMNLEAIQMAKNLGANRITLPVEDNAENMAEVSTHSDLSTVAIAYQDIPLFTSANCIKNKCSHCTKEACTLPLQKGHDLYSAHIKDCNLTLISNKTFYMGKLRNKIPADFYRIDFINRFYSSEQVADLVSKIMSGTNIPMTHSGNLKKNI